jgi:hypothetical protein
LLSEPLNVQMVNFVAVQQHLPIDRFVEPLQDTDNGALTTTRSSDDGGDFSSWKHHAEILEDACFRSTGVDMADVAEFNIAFHLKWTDQGITVSNRLAFNDSEDVLSSRSSKGHGLDVGPYVAEQESSDIETHEYGDDSTNIFCSASHKSIALPYGQALSILVSMSGLCHCEKDQRT